MDTKNSIQNSHRLKESEVSFFKHIDINMVGSTKGSSSFLLGEIDFSIDCRSSWSFANSWRTIEKKVAFATVADLYYEIPSRLAFLRLQYPDFTIVPYSCWLFLVPYGKGNMFFEADQVRSFLGRWKVDLKSNSFPEHWINSQGSLNYPNWGNQTRQMYCMFEWFAYNNAKHNACDCWGWQCNVP